MTVDIPAFKQKACLQGGDLDEELSVAVCSHSVPASNGSQFSKASLTAGEGISTPNPSLAVGEPHFVQDQSDISNIWETTLFPLKPRCPFSPVPTISTEIATEWVFLWTGCSLPSQF